MKPKLLIGSVVILASTLAMANANNSSTPKYKADVPKNLLTPNIDNSKYLGEIKMLDGFPTQDTSKKSFDFIDTSRAVQLYTNGIPIASMYAMLEGNKKIGLKANLSVGITEQLLDARSIWLTPNTTTPYITAEIDVKKGPVVIEVGTPVIGLIDDAYFKYVADIGMGGQDRGKGGKYLLVGDDYKGEVPEGYFVLKTSTYRHWLLLRAVSLPGQNIEQTIAAFKKGFRMYPLSDASKPTPNHYVNLSGKKFSTIHASNATFFKEINEVIQYEPANSGDPEILGLAASLGIRKGQTFAPDKRMKIILTEAAKIGNAVSRATLYTPRNETMYPYPDRQWLTASIQSHEFIDKNGAISLDDRLTFHFYATGITPFMVKPQVGSGSVYTVAVADSNGDMLSGDKAYKLTLPAPIPAKDFWSVMVYDNQTRSILETDQKEGGIDSLGDHIKLNSDGSVTLYFSKSPIKGKESNWVQIMPEKGFNVILRLYGPLQEYFDKAWKPGDFKPM